MMKMCTHISLYNW